MWHPRIVKKFLLFLPIWLIFILITYILCFKTMFYLTKTKEMSTLVDITVREMVPKNLYQVYASLPQTLESFEGAIQTKDARPEIVKQYLTKYNSPLAPFSEEIVKTGDEYKNEKVDDLWKYIVVIAQCESNLGTKIPEGSNNAWGLGIPTGAKKGLTYEAWPDGIKAVSKFLNKLMLEKNLYTPEEWGPIYAPPSAKNGGSWAKCVRHFLDDLQ